MHYLCIYDPYLAYYEIVKIDIRLQLGKAEGIMRLI